MKLINFQVVKNFELTGQWRNEAQIVEGLRSDKMKACIEPIRRKVIVGDDTGATDLKKQLPAIIVSGHFKGARKMENLIEYTQIICLDLDKIAIEKIAALKEKTVNCPYTFISFLSPSGRGLKIFVKVSSGANEHRNAYAQVLNFYSNLLEVKFDEVTNDITRLTFMSYDPDTYYYPDSDVFQVVDMPSSVQRSIEIATIENIKERYDYAYRYTEQKMNYESGNRNNFLFRLSNNCNRYGIPKEVFLTFLDWCDLPENEIVQVVNSAYKHESEFNTWKIKQWSSGFQPQNEKLSYEDIVGNTPIISLEVKRQLPSLISEMIMVYSDRQSDMALTSLLSLLSGIINNTKGVYNNSLIYPTLSTMITAPSGSGKSVTDNMRRILLPLHDRLMQNGGQQKGLFLSDNTNSTALIKGLEDNAGRGILFSTDMGFLGHALGRDIKGLQAILRTAHSGEVITYGRSLQKSTVTVANPRLTVCLCATPPEFRQLFTSTEDGLISRFIHYCFTPDKKWQDIRQINIQEHINRQQLFSGRITDLYYYLQDKTFEFKMSPEQLLAVNEMLAEELAKAGEKANWAAVNPIIKRMGQTIFKLSMIIATVRAWESNKQCDVLSIDADDFDCVMQLSGVYFQHAASIVNYVTDNVTSGLEAELQKFLNVLPEGTFKRKEAIVVAKKHGFTVSDRTIDYWLKGLCKRNLLSCEFNNYRKLKDQDRQAA